MVDQPPSFISTLGLNWKLLAAQALNFGVVLFILWRWVFKPVGGALESRRQKIEKAVRDAEEVERRLAAIEAARQEQLREAQNQASALLAKSEAQAASAKQEMLSAAKAQTERMMSATRAAMAAEKEQMMREVRGELAELTVMATEKIIKEKMDEKKDREMVQEALKFIK